MPTFLRLAATEPMSFSESQDLKSLTAKHVDTPEQMQRGRVRCCQQTCKDEAKLEQEAGMPWRQGPHLGRFNKSVCLKNAFFDPTITPTVLLFTTSHDFVSVLWVSDVLTEGVKLACVRMEWRMEVSGSLVATLVCLHLPPCTKETQFIRINREIQFTVKEKTFGERAQRRTYEAEREVPSFTRFSLKRLLRMDAEMLPLASRIPVNMASLLRSDSVKPLRNSSSCRHQNITLILVGWTESKHIFWLQQFKCVAWGEPS